MTKDALAGEQFSGQADHETEHCQAAIPGFCEGNKAKTGGGVSHGWRGVTTENIVTVYEGGRQARLGGLRPWGRSIARATP